MIKTFAFTILKAILVAKAVLPIEGLPASIIKSVLWSPPKSWSKSVKPVGIPESCPSLLYADSALLIASTNDVENFLKSWLLSPVDDKLYNFTSAFSMMLEALVSKSKEFASFDISSEIFSISLLWNKS